MRSLEEVLAAIKPSATIDHFDVVGIWLRRRLSPREYERIDRACLGGADFRPVTSFVNPYSPYQWKLSLRQAERPALERVAELAGAFVNYIEVTRNIVVSHPRQAETLDLLFRDHFLQPWHGNKGTVTYKAGFSTREKPPEGQRRTGHSYDWYSDKPCKITSARHIFHFEGRHLGRRAVRSLGIEHPRDLLQFDFAAYFAKRFSYWYVIDFERLGRYHANQRSGAKRKLPIIRDCDGYAYNRDAAVGGILYRKFAQHEDGSRSLQRFIDVYSRGPYLQRVSKPADTLYDDHGAECLTSSEVRLPQPHLSFSLPAAASSQIHNPNATEHPPLRPPIPLHDIDVPTVPIIEPRPRTRIPPAHIIEPRPLSRPRRVDADLQPQQIIEPRPRTRIPDDIQPRPRTRRILIEPRPLTRLRNVAA
jgi:hypothetical protein